MTRYRHAFAAAGAAAGAAGDWSQLTNSCLDDLGGRNGGGTLGLLYATAELADDLPSILTFLRDSTGVPHWAGAVGGGVCATGIEAFGEPALSVLIADLPADDFRILPTVVDAPDDTVDAIGDWLAARAPRFGIVHGDPANARVVSIVPALAQATGCFFVGGLTSGGPDGGGQIADGVTGGGVSGVLFAADFTVAAGLTQGCSPLGPPHRVTKAAEHVITSLDERPALDVLKQDIGEVLARDLSRLGGYVHAAVPVAGSDTGDYLVRNLIGIDPAKGWLAISGAFAPGDQVMFVRRDPESAITDLREMVTRVARRAGEAASAAVYHSCVARGPNQFGPGSVELRIIREALGDLPLVGFFGSGEISHDRLYSYTGVLTLLL